MKNLKSLKSFVFGNHRKIEVTVGTNVYQVTKETIKRNYYFSETYRKAGEHIGKNENVVYKNLREYTRLLKQGNIKFFNPCLGVSYPILIIKGGKVKYELVKEFCVQNDIPFSWGKTKA
tara:strand:+ start:286 stop:642 length:357 start_codon:yes stop_codon:yes gene_type:complete